MTIKIEAAQLKKALGYAETGLADYTRELSLEQKGRVATFVRRHAFLRSAQALYVNTAELERVMVDTGHLQCGECEEWFTEDEVFVIPPELDPDAANAAEESDPTPESVIRCLDCNEEHS